MPPPQPPTALPAHPGSLVEPSSPPLLPPPVQKPYRTAPGRLIVKLRPDVVAAMDDGANGLRFTRQAGLPNAGVYSILDGSDVHAKAREVSQLPGGWAVSGRASGVCSASRRGALAAVHAAGLCGALLPADGKHLTWRGLAFFVLSFLQPLSLLSRTIW